jgi:hypothetical protein
MNIDWLSFPNKTTTITAISSPYIFQSPSEARTSCIIYKLLLLLLFASHMLTFRRTAAFVLSKPIVWSNAVSLRALPADSLFARLQNLQKNQLLSTTAAPQLHQSPSSLSEQTATATATTTVAAKIRQTGAFVRQWPTVFTADTHYRRAYRKAMKEVKVDEKIKNVRNAQRKYAVQLLDTLMQALTVPLSDNIAVYQKQFRNLHPFEVSHTKSPTIL